MKKPVISGLNLEIWQACDYLSYSSGSEDHGRKSDSYSCISAERVRNFEFSVRNFSVIFCEIPIFVLGREHFFFIYCSSFGLKYRSIDLHKCPEKKLFCSADVLPKK